MIKSQWTYELTHTITRLDWGRKGSQNLLAVGTENQILFVDMEKQNIIDVLDVPENRNYIKDFGQTNVGFYILQWSPNGEYLLFNSGDWIGCYYVNERKTGLLKIGEKLASIYIEAQDAAGMKCIAWTPDSQHFALVSDFKESCKIFDITLQLSHCVRNVKKPGKNKVSLSPIAWFPNKDMIAYGLNNYPPRTAFGPLPPHYGDHQLFVYDMIRATESPLNYYGWIWMMEWDQIKKNLLYIATNKGNLDVFNVQKNQIENTFNLSNSAIIACFPLAKRHKILFLNIKGELGECDLNTGATKILLQRYDLNGQETWSITMSIDPNEDFLVTGFSKKIAVYSID